MAKIKIGTIPGDPEVAKQKLYDLIKDSIKFNALSPTSLHNNLEFFEDWWKELGDIVISENTIDVAQIAGRDISKLCRALYWLAGHTGLIITTSFNGTKIIMVDQFNG